MARTIFSCGGIQSKGTGRSIVVTDEYWHAEDIRLNLLEKHNDPRKGDLKNPSDSSLRVGLSAVAPILEEPDFHWLSQTSEWS